MNNVNLIGRSGSDPELKYTPKGTAVIELNLAVDDGWGDNKKTAWIGVTIWGSTAELAARAIKKGDRVGITGRLTQEEWEDKTTGKKNRKTKVTCEDLHLLSPKREDSDYEAREPRQPQQRRDSTSAGNDEDDDIPF